jgi:hypothetical protein
MYPQGDWPILDGPPSVPTPAGPVTATVGHVKYNAGVPS